MVWRALRRSVLFLSVLTAFAVEAQAEKRVALVIGNDRYPALASSQQLQKAANDAEAVGDALSKLGFQVIRGRNLGRQGMIDKISEFTQKLATGDIAAFFYAGHGVAIGGTNFLLPSDVPNATPEAEGRVRGASIAEADVIAEIQAKGVRVAFLVIDACRNNPFPRSGTRSIGNTRGLADAKPVRGVFTLYSAGIGQEALDRLEPNDKNRNSVFTRIFVQELAKPQHLGDLAVEVREKVAELALKARNDQGEASPHDQTPAYYDQTIGGRIFIAGRPAAIETSKPAPAPVQAPPPAPDPRVIEFSFWEAVRNSDSVATVRSYLDRYPNGAFAPLARARIAELEKKTASLPPAQQPAPAPAIAPGGTVRVAVAGPFTGPNAAFGTQMRRGVEQAAEDINATGGILGQRITLEFADDASNPDQARSAAGRLSQNGTQFVIGHFNSSLSIPASEIYEKAGIVAITPASTNPRLTERGLWNVFRTCGRDDQQALVAADFVVRQPGQRRLVILHDTTTFGQGLAEQVRKAVNAAGLREVLFESVKLGSSDFSALVAQMKTLRPDFVYWGGLHVEAAHLVKQMRAAGVTATVIGSDGITTSEFAALGGPAVEGTLMTFAQDARNRAEARAAVAKLRTGKFEPEGYTLYSYAALEIVKQAAEAARTLDPKRVAQQMRSGQRFKTALGEIVYDQKGDITRPDYVMYVWRKGSGGQIGYFER
jgi:branched-chain amino acid transport system substrate-binding protein